MTEKAKKGSWADETEEESPVPPVNAWSKGNPWGIAVDKGPVVPPSEKDFPEPGKARDEEKGSQRDSQRDPHRERDSQDFRRQEKDPHQRDNRQDFHSREREGYSSRDRDNSHPPRDRDYSRESSYSSREPRENYSREPREREASYSRDREGSFPRDRESSSRERDSFKDSNRDRDSNRDTFGNSRTFEGSRRNFGRAPYRNEHDDRDRLPSRERDRDKEREPKERAPMPFPTEPPFTAFVGNLPYNLVQEDLISFFAVDCKVTSVRLLSDRDSQRPKGFGYVEFEDLESLKKAVERSGQSLVDRPLRIDVATARADDKDRRKNDTFWNKPPRDRSKSVEEVPLNSSEHDDDHKERRKLELKPRSVEAKPAEPMTSEAYKNSQKANPFANAKPRDENIILKKKEEERKQREQHTKKELTPEPETKPTEKSNGEISDDKPFEKSPVQGRQASDKPRDRDNKGREDKRKERRDDKLPREDRPREDRPREDRPREDRPREDRPREDRPFGRGRGGPTKSDDRVRRDNDKFGSRNDDKSREERGPRRGRDDKKDDKTNKRESVPSRVAGGTKEEKGGQDEDKVRNVNPFNALPQEDD